MDHFPLCATNHYCTTLAAGLGRLGLASTSARAAPPRPVCIASLVPHCANRGGCVRPLESGLTSGDIHPLAYITWLEEEITAVSAALQDADEAP